MIGTTEVSIKKHINILVLGSSSAFMVLGNFKGTWEGQEFEIEWIKNIEEKGKKGFYQKGMKIYKKISFFGTKDIYHLL